MKLQIKANRKILLAIICIAIMAFASGVFYARAQSGSSGIFTISAGVYPGAPSYRVYSNGAGNYYAKDTYGSVDFTSTNATTVVNDAVANGGLIVLIGSFQLGSSSITITSSNTTLDLSQAILYSTGNAINAHGTPSAYLALITVKGGQLIGSNSGIQSGIVFQYVTDFLIQGVTVHSFAHEGIMLEDCQYGKVENCNPYNNGMDGIGVLAGTGTSCAITILNNICTNNGQDGIYVDNGATANINGFSGIVISTNYCNGNGNGNNGARLYGVLLGTHNDNVTVTDNTVKGSWSDGIALSTLKYAIVSNNILKDNGAGSGSGTGSGITFNDVSDSICSNNQAHYNAGWGFRLLFSSQSNTIEGNDFSSNSQYGIQVSSSTTDDCYYNNIENNFGTISVSISPSNCMFSNNPNFPTDYYFAQFVSSSAGPVTITFPTAFAGTPTVVGYGSDTQYFGTIYFSINSTSIVIHWTGGIQSGNIWGQVHYQP